MPLPAAPPPPLSSFHSLSSHGLPFLSFPARRPLRRGDLAIRMGGGPRTYPGGVSKWQWKRMQARKAKQLLKARLARERQLYEMRKRAELRHAAAHLERPWDPDSSSAASAAVAAAPNLHSVAADDQLKALADRFHRPGGVDLWNDRDGPQVFAFPDTGRASARFFPKDAVHSVQPYALLGARGESVQKSSWSADEEEVRDGERAQGARRNAPEEDFHSEHELTVRFMERNGMWEPVDALDGEGDSISSDLSWNNDDDVISDSEDKGDVRFGHDQRAIVRQDGRKSGASKWKSAKAMAADSNKGWDQSSHGFFSDSGGPRQDRFEQRWQERSNVDIRKRPTGRAKALRTIDGSNTIGKGRMGGGSFSDSEVTSRGFERNWRARNRADRNDSAGKWKVSHDAYGNVTRKQWVADESDSYSDSGTRDDKFEPKWKIRNRSIRSANRRDRPRLKCDNPNAAHGDRPERYMRGNNGDRRDMRLEYHDANATNGDRPWRRVRGGNGDGKYEYHNGFTEELEEPTWKPRRNGAMKSNDRRIYSGDRSGRFGGRGGNGSARWPGANPTVNFRGNGRDEDSRHRVSRNGGQRFREDGYSLRPTSELHRHCFVRGRESN